MGLKLFIDDERRAPAEYNRLVRTVAEAINALEAAKKSKEPIDLVSFDWDAHSHLNWTFQEVAEWMAENHAWPKELRIHSFNTWTGRPWLLDFFEKNAPKSTKINPEDPWAEDLVRADLDESSWIHHFHEAQK